MRGSAARTRTPRQTRMRRKTLKEGDRGVGVPVAGTAMVRLKRAGRLGGGGMLPILPPQQGPTGRLRAGGCCEYAAAVGRRGRRRRRRLRRLRRGPVRLGAARAGPGIPLRLAQLVLTRASGADCAACHGLLACTGPPFGRAGGLAL